MAPFTSTIAVVLVCVNGCSRVQSSVVVSSSAFSMALLSNGVYGVLLLNMIEQQDKKFNNTNSYIGIGWVLSQQNKDTEGNVFFYTCCSLPSAQPLCSVKSWLTSPALSSVTSNESVYSMKNCLRYRYRWRLKIWNLKCVSCSLSSDAQFRWMLMIKTLKLGTDSWSKEAELSSLVGVSKSKGRWREDFDVLLLVGCFTDQLET